MREEDRPPEWMWPFHEELEEHFEALKDARENGDDGARSMRNEAA